MSYPNFLIRNLKFSFSGPYGDRLDDTDGGPSKEALSTALNILTARVIVLQAKLAYRDNAQLAIHKLPLEIFSRILYYALTLPGAVNPYHRRLIILRNVCKIWSEVVKSSPTFWTYVDGRSSAKSIEYIKKESKNASLYIRCNTLVANPEILMGCVSDDETRRRWDTFYFHGKSERFATVGQHLENGPTPRLTELFLYNQSVEDTHDGATQPFFALQNEGRTLRHVHLRGISLAMESPRLQDLRSLQLSWLSSPPSLLQVTQILLASPCLDTLVLSHFVAPTSPADSTRHTQTELAEIDLPFLTVFQLQRVPSHYYDLARRIRAPRCREVNLGGTAREIDLRKDLVMNSTVWDPQSTQLACTLQRPLLMATMVEISATKTAIDMQTRSDLSTACNVVVHAEAAAPKDLPWIIAALRTIAIDCPVKVAIKCWEGFHLSVPKCFGGFEALSKLDVTTGSAYTNVLDLISMKTSSGWEVPRLSQLCFRFSRLESSEGNDFQKLKAVVRDRWGDLRQEYPRPPRQGFISGRRGWHIPPYRSTNVALAPSHLTPPVPLVALSIVGPPESQFSQWREAVADCEWMVVGSHPEVLEAASFLFNCRRY